MKRDAGPASRAFLALVIVTFAACGGGDSAAPAPEGALAYVNTTCRDGGDGIFTAAQELLVQRGDSPPVPVARVAIGPTPLPSVCGIFGTGLAGEASSLRFGVFQRLGMHPDGTTLVFEVTDDFSPVGRSFVPPEQKGIFVVRTDGSGLRRLGDASRVKDFTVLSAEINFVFSPNGRNVGFTDMGPGPGGEEAAQAFTLDIETGRRTQITHLPPVPASGIDGTGFADFLDDRTIVFYTLANPDGLNPGGKFGYFTVTVDDQKLKSLPSIALPNGVLIPNVAITGLQRSVLSVQLPGMQANPNGISGIHEVFINDGTNVLQLTDFRRVDTAEAASVLSVDGQRVFFTASADPFGANPTAACQIFSVDALGGDLHQLTNFTLPRRSAFGCFAPRRSLGCVTVFNFNGHQSQDARTGQLIFSSSCDPFDVNPESEQIFAIRPDGSGLRQLTNARGTVRQTDGSVEVELPGPWAYGPYR